MQYFKRILATGAVALVAQVECTPVVAGGPPTRVEMVAARSISVSGSVTPSAVSCGLYSSADVNDSNQNIDNLQSKGGTATAPANGCSRLGCYNTSGFYLCNNQDEDITIDLSDVAALGALINVACAATSGSNEDNLSGQMFSGDNGGYNVIVGFCDNNEATDTLPSSYTPPGPNGDPGVVCGYGSNPECDFGTCDSGSIVATSQEVVDCNTYLGPTYVGAGGEISYDAERTISEAYTIGGSFLANIGSLSGPIGAAGFSVSYTQTTTTGNTSGATASCGSATDSSGTENGWTCAMQITPQCLQTSGTCNLYIGTDTQIGTWPWTLVAPEVDADDISDFNADLCVCTNCPDWASSGAPQPNCTLSCDTTCLAATTPTK